MSARGCKNKRNVFFGLATTTASLMSSRKRTRPAFLDAAAELATASAALAELPLSRAAAAARASGGGGAAAVAAAASAAAAATGGAGSAAASAAAAAAALVGGEGAAVEEEGELCDDGEDVDSPPPPPPDSPDAADPLHSRPTSECRRCGLVGGHSWRICDATAITPPQIDAGARSAFEAQHFSAAAHTAARAHAQLSPGWFDSRLPNLTGSTLGAIFGEINGSNARLVLLDKVKEAMGEPRTPPNVMMQYGSRCEGPLLAALCNHLRVELLRLPLLGVDCLAASPDGVIVIDRPAGLEALPLRGAPVTAGTEPLQIICVEAKGWCAREYGGMRWSAPKRFSISYLLQMMLQAYVLEQTYHVEVKELMLVGLWRRDMHIVIVPYSRELRSLCDTMRAALAGFSRDFLVPALIQLSVVERVRNLKLAIPNSVAEALEIAWDARQIVLNTVVVPAAVKAMATELELMQGLPNIPADTSTMLRILGVPAAVETGVRSWISSLHAGSGDSGGGGGGAVSASSDVGAAFPFTSSGDFLADKLLIIQQTLTLAVVHDAQHKADSGAGYSVAVAAPAFVAVIARGGSLALHKQVDGAAEQAGLASEVARHRTTLINVILAQNAPNGVLQRSLDSQIIIARSLARCVDREQRLAILLEPASVDFMRAGVPPSSIVGREIVYMVSSGEREALAVKRDSGPACRTTYVAILAALALKHFLVKIGRGDYNRAQVGARPGSEHQHVCLYIEPPYLMHTNAGESVRLLVRVAFEALLSLLQAPVARLPGVGMAGEPTSDRSASGA